MALKIRLRQQGRHNRHTFRLVVTDIRNPRDGKYLETLGSYNPFQAENNFTLNKERLQFWLQKGALLTESAEQLVSKLAPEVVKGLKEKEQAKRMKLVVKRRAQKEKKGAKAKPAAPAKKAAAVSEEEPAPKAPKKTAARKKKEE
jgi:small subunit ribosomal protein S16